LPAEKTVRKINIAAAFAIAAFCSTTAFGSSSFIGGSMTVKGSASAPAPGACSSPLFAENCPSAPNTTQSCSCVKVANAKVTGPNIGTGKANLSLTEDKGDGDGTDGSESPSGCVPVFGGGVFID